VRRNLRFTRRWPWRWRQYVSPKRWYVQWTQNISELHLRHWKRVREDGKSRGEQDGKESVWACYNWKYFFPLLISTQSVEFWYIDFYTTLCFVNQRNKKTNAMLAHALTGTRYFYSLNVILSHLIPTSSQGVSTHNTNTDKSEKVGFEVLTAVSIKMAVFWVVAPCSLVFYQTTRCYNPEDSHLHTHRRENLKSYLG
jgi:hypothetical protein